MANAVIGALRVNLGIDTAEFQNGLAESQASLAKWAKAAAVAAAAAGAAIATALAAGVKRSLDEADELSKISQKIGVPIEELSKLKYAADLSGVSIESLSTATGKLAQNIVKASEGGKAAKGFDALGISVKNADGSLKSTSQVIGEVSDKFSNLADGPVKTAAAMAIFGKTGADLIPLLNGGSAAIKEMTDEAKALGLEISAKTGAAAEQFNDNISRIGYAVDGLTLGLTAALAPALAVASDAIVGFAKGALQLLDYLPALAENAAIAGGALAIMFAPTILAAVGALAVAIGTGLVGAVNLLTVAIASNPLGALAIAITGLVVLIYNFRDEIQKAIGVDVVAIAKNAANMVIGSFVAAFEDIKFVWQQFPNIIGAAVIGAVNTVVNGVSRMINVVIDNINDFTQHIAGISSQIGIEISPISHIDVQDIRNEYAEALGAAVGDRNKAISEAMNRDYIGTIATAFSGATAEATSFGNSVGGANGQLNAMGGSGAKAAEGANSAKDAWAGLRDVSAGVKEKMAALKEQTRAVSDAWTDFGRGGQSILEGLVDGTLSWKDALKSALPVLLDLVTNLMNAQNPAGFGSGMLGSFLNGLTGLGGGSGYGKGYFPPAPGGGLTGFAMGGISDVPAIFGEGKYAEAAVPLPDGRSIPVTLSGGDGGPQSTSGTIQVVLSPDLEARILERSGNQSIEIVKQNNQAQRNFKQNGGQEW
ncbi:hypothetical protein SAMN05428967_4474 [Phyllobacterium sp. YR620]|uniref:phage tail tape measure protein n=1 Tax=Phyllobacterium sp. YR620 TaxID=1881066 RepID=UPI00087F8B67|nr:phage tail tape measure protein [Phyllobacterium sp. YR620]SDP92523.1 hypothetical protein SAMN05428967_4474 [Phyllobacterium sp. YR620]